MNRTPEHDWQPDPQLLAAYFDGELAGPESTDLRARVEAWLQAHPEAAEEWADLQKLLRDTAPAEPSESTWQHMLTRIDAQRPAPARRPWFAAGIVAACVLVFAGLLGATLHSLNKSPQITIAPPHEGDDIDVMQVVSASDVTILRIEGADADAIIVGTFPVSGTMELADPGEVCISCKCPRVIVRQDPPHRPMVWPRVDVE